MERRPRGALAIGWSTLAIGLLAAACSARSQGTPPEANGSVPPLGAREGQPAAPAVDAGDGGSAGAGGTDTLTCAWLRGPKNCWAFRHCPVWERSISITIA